MIPRRNPPRVPWIVAQARAIRPAQRPCLEALKDRCVPALTVHEYDTPTVMSNPFGIVSYGSTSYFTESGANKIANISADGTFKTDYPVPTANSQPFAMT